MRSVMSSLSAEDFAVRRANAAERFCQWVREVTGVSESEALTVFNVYVRFNAVKICARTGQFTLSHGALGDPEVLRSALVLAQAAS